MDTFAFSKTLAFQRLQPDGKILAGGSFTTIAGQSRSYLARLNTDGTLDTNFNADLNGGVTGVALQADGSVVIGGGFTTVGGQASSGLARVSSSGAVDPTWSPQVAGGAAEAIAIQPDGRILIAGSFTSVCGLPRSRLARVDAVTPADHRLVCDATGVTWWRGGASPEICGPRFEISADATNWTSLGSVGFGHPGVRRLAGKHFFARHQPADLRHPLFRRPRPGQRPPALLPRPLAIGRQTWPRTTVVQATTNPPTTSTFIFTDPDASLFPMRLYRLLSP